MVHVVTPHASDFIARKRDELRAAQADVVRKLGEGVASGEAAVSRPPPPESPGPRSSPRRSPAAGQLDRARHRAPTTSRSGRSTSAALASGRRSRRDRGHAGPADRAREHDDRPRDLQPHHVDLRGHGGGAVRNPARARVFSYISPLPGGRPRRGLPAPQPAVVLAVRCRRVHDLRQLPVAPLRGRLRRSRRCRSRSISNTHGVDSWVIGPLSRCWGSCCSRSTSS